jgi:hypothetical protein
MYDNIKVALPLPFADNGKQVQEFCARFSLFVQDGKRQVFSNKGYEILTQNKGVYMRLKNRKLTLEFSLHKFYNFCVCGKPFNYNNFNFVEAKQAAAWLFEMFKPYFDITQAKVVKYEVGINVQTSETPDLYLRELRQLNINAKVLPIKEDIHYKEYKQFSTQRDKDKRIIYIFYNKTFEARSKERKQAARAIIPENILRVEKDNKRPIENILFARLFENDFIILTISEFKQRFCGCLEYKSTLEKPDAMSKANFELLQLLFDNGKHGAMAKVENDYKGKTIGRTTYFNRLRTVRRLTDILPKITLTNSRRANELSVLIASKILEVQNFGLF